MSDYTLILYYMKEYKMLPPLVFGWRFLYKTQQEQKQQDTRVTIVIAAAAPKVTPSSNGKLKIITLLMLIK